MCPWCRRGRFQQPRPSTDSGDSRGAVCRRRGQHRCEHAEASAVPTKRKSVEVARTHLTVQNSSIHRWRRFIKHSSGRRQTPDIMQRHIPMIHKVQAFDPKMNKAEAQLNRVRSSAHTGSSERRADSVQKSRKAPGRAKHFERRECRQWKRLAKAVVNGSRGNGARRA